MRWLANYWVKMKVVRQIEPPVFGLSEGPHCKFQISRSLSSVRLKICRLRYEISVAGPEGILVIRNCETRPDKGARYSPT